MKTIFLSLCLAAAMSSLAQAVPLQLFSREFDLRGAVKSVEGAIFEYTSSGKIRDQPALRYRSTYRKDGIYDSLFSARKNDTLHLDYSFRFINDTLVETVHPENKSLLKSLINANGKLTYMQVITIPEWKTEIYYEYDTAGQPVQERKRNSRGEEEIIRYMYEALTDGRIKRTKSNGKNGEYDLLNASGKILLSVQTAEEHVKTEHSYTYNENNDLVRLIIQKFRRRKNQWVADPASFEQEYFYEYDGQKNWLVRNKFINKFPESIEKRVIVYWKSL